MGGATPLADCRSIYRRLPEPLVRRFSDVGLMYRRNFHRMSSISWQKAYGTNTRSGVEQYCRLNHMKAEWAGENLTVRYRRWAALSHPRSHYMTWFNHGTFFNPYTLEPTVKTLATQMGEDWLPYQTFYGDGGAIELDTLRILDEAYKSETVIFPWNTNDILMLDNMRIAHGREAFSGPRDVLVAMKRRVRCEDLAERSQYEAFVQH